MDERIVALSTAGSSDEARKIARGLVEARLAACVNIVPGIESIYRWQGEVEQTPEWLLVIKTRRSLVRAVESRLRELHSYELPELIVLPIAEGSAAYLRWIDQETGGDAEL